MFQADSAFRNHVKVGGLGSCDEDRFPSLVALDVAKFRDMFQSGGGYRMKERALSEDGCDGKQGGT